MLNKIFSDKSLVAPILRAKFLEHLYVLGVNTTLTCENIWCLEEKPYIFFKFSKAARLNNPMTFCN